MGFDGIEDELQDDPEAARVTTQAYVAAQAQITAQEMKAEANRICAENADNDDALPMPSPYEVESAWAFIGTKPRAPPSSPAEQPPPCPEPAYETLSY